MTGQSKPTITAFESSPDKGAGLARDTRVRWTFEEVGQPYDVRLVSFKAMKEPAHLALHPFGQIPTYEDGDLALFETGAMILHLAQHHAGLLPDEANARARAITWMFAGHVRQGGGECGCRLAAVGHAAASASAMREWVVSAGASSSAMPSICM